MQQLTIPHSNVIHGRDHRLARVVTLPHSFAAAGLDLQPDYDFSVIVRDGLE